VRVLTLGRRYHTIGGAVTFCIIAMIVAEHL
jgi:hypothetical protein